MSEEATAGGRGASPAGNGQRGAHPIAALQRRAGSGQVGSALELIVAVAGPIGAFLLCWGRVHETILVSAVLIPTPALLALLSLRHRSTWAAQDALVRMDGVAADRAVSREPTASFGELAANPADRSSVRAGDREVDGLPGRASARLATGRPGPGSALRVWLVRFRFAVVTALFGPWLLAAILVGLATAGGVVWF